MKAREPTTSAAAVSSRDIIPDAELMRLARDHCGVSLGACYGCKKCSNGCPLTFAMDLYPYQVVRLAQLGQIEALKACRTIWICTSCQTCFTRCPNEVNLPRFMDWLKQTVSRTGATVPEEQTHLFHRLFLREVSVHGRVFESSLMGRYLLTTGGIWGTGAAKNVRLGLAMLKRGRLKLLPSRIKDRRWLKALFNKETRL